MDQKNKFYVTTPIYYGTAKPHVGSLYSTLIADVLARWHKLKGEKAFFLTGTDEHGQKVAQAAAKAGKDPKSFVDSFIGAYQNTWHAYELAYDKFIRTTDPEHIKAVQHWITVVQEKGDIYKSLYSGWYCTPCETYVTDVQESQTKAPLCPSCGRETTFISEECYFFRLSAYQEKLLQFYQDNPHFIIPHERLNEVLSFVKSGLRDLSISRTTISWGVPFPDDPEHVVYVWTDALINYISAIGYGDLAKKEQFNFWWPADIHVLGKDIVRFHAIFWPAFLMAADLQPPKQLLVHGWIKVGEQKMSKSLGNVLDPQFLLEQYGAEPVRFYLMRYMTITHDSPISLDDLEQRISTDLANDLGNLLNRMLVLAAQNQLMVVPVQHVWSDISLALRDACWTLITDYQQFLDDCVIHTALAHVWKYIHQVNSYFHALEPWKLAKTDELKFVEVISAVCHSLYTIAILLWPVMPHKMEQLLQSLGFALPKDENVIEELVSNRWDRSFTLLMIQPLFAKGEQKSTEKKEQKVAEPAEPMISINDFAKIKLRVGIIEDAQDVVESEKLLKLRVNFGPLGIRQIIAGIKKYYVPAELVGKQAVFVTNLQPRKIMGLESHGMLLLTQDEQGNASIVVPQKVMNAGALLK